MFNNQLYRPARIPLALRRGTFVLIFGLAATGCSASEKDEPQPVAAAVIDTASPSLSVTSSMECDVEDTQQTVNEETLFCTEGEEGALVWMDMEEHDRVIAAVAAEKALKEAAALKAAEAKKAEEAAAKKAAEAKAAADKVAAQKAADEKVAANKAATTAFDSCSDAAKAGAFNIPAGAPGYGPHLDRDGDGIACENSGGSVQAPAQPAQPAEPAPSVYYPNCPAARAAGAAPVYANQPGYGPHLDRDGDGIGCE